MRASHQASDLGKSSIFTAWCSSPLPGDFQQVTTTPLRDSVAVLRTDCSLACMKRNQQVSMMEHRDAGEERVM